VRELHRLEHRLVVLLLVPDHELMDVRDAAVVDHVERAGPDLIEVLERLAPSQER